MSEDNRRRAFANSMVRQRFGHDNIEWYLTESKPQSNEELKAWVKKWGDVSYYIFTKEEKAYIGPVIESYLPLVNTDVNSPIGHFFELIGDAVLNSFRLGDDGYMIKFYPKGKDRWEYVYFGVRPRNVAQQFTENMAKFHHTQEFPWPNYEGFKFLCKRLSQAIAETLQQALKDYDEACARNINGDDIIKADTVIIVIQDGTLARYDDLSFFQQQKIHIPPDITNEVFDSPDGNVPPLEMIARNFTYTWRHALVRIRQDGKVTKKLLMLSHYFATYLHRHPAPLPVPAATYKP